MRIALNEFLEDYEERRIVAIMGGHNMSRLEGMYRQVAFLKMFENSLREEGLLAIAKGGIIYSPGSAGTIREIFQDLTQNHYETYGYASPMIFLGTKFRTEERPIYPLIRAMIDEKKLNQALSLEIFDENEQIILHLEKVF